MGKLKLLGMTPSELSELAKECGLPAYAGKQMARWMYVRKVRSIDDMTDISKAGRETLKERYELGGNAYMGFAAISV